VKYRVRDLECDSLGELEQIGGKTRRFEIEVSNGVRRSSLRLTGRSTYLHLSCPPEDFWSKHGKIKAIFEGRSIRWKNAVNSAVVESFVGWTLFYLAVAVLFYALVPVGWRQSVPSWAISGALVVGLFVYVFAFSGSVVLLRYAHTRSFRLWFQQHGTQLAFLVVGVALKYGFDFVFQYFHSH
jgi:hypothetical protein